MVMRVAWLVLCVSLPLPCFAQAPAAAEPWRIIDNSFLVEEAFNQDPGVFQNIFGAVRVNGDWAASFTQEWPVGGQRNQLSYTVVWLQVSPASGIGDTLINYRYQVMTEGPGRPAFAPRASVITPTGNSRHDLGAGSIGLQVDLPFSKQTGDWYWHWNAGLTWLPRAKSGDTDRRADLDSPFLAGSAIYRLRPMVNLMLESLVSFDQTMSETGRARHRGFTLSPGVRGGWDIGKKQVVVGFALPTTWRSGSAATGVFLYFSYELPFRIPDP